MNTTKKAGDILLAKIKNTLDNLIDMIDEDTTDDARLDDARDIINDTLKKVLDI